MHRYSLLITKTIRRVKQLARRMFLRLKDKIFSTYIYAHTKGHPRLQNLINQLGIFEFTEFDQIAINNQANHFFNLLGSGWVKVCSRDLNSDQEKRFKKLPRSNKKISHRIAALIPKEYQLIDWHTDFKSGYHWKPDIWYRDVSHHVKEGVDIKVPWELSRMQHLPEIAVLYTVTRDKKLAEEYRSQVLDWIANNPPRFGVNWNCTMDIGIRIANWLIAYDIFCAAGVHFDQQFVSVLTCSAVDHGRHITSNLEWSESRRSNHYLANIAGLLVTAAYLESSSETDSWLLFSIQELLAESERQFLLDGGHFEASTSYHRLCAEMIAVSAMYAEAVPQERLQSIFTKPVKKFKFKPGFKPDIIRRIKDSYIDEGHVLPEIFYIKLTAAALFTKDLCKPDGTVVQIGDTDSGRFVRIGGWQLFEVSGQEIIDQSYLNHQQWLAWASVLLDNPSLLDRSLTPIWQPSLSLANLLKKDSKKKTINFDPLVLQMINLNLPMQKKITHTLSGQWYIGNNALAGMERKSYPLFGIYIIKTEQIFLVIRCGKADHDGVGVHAHEDQLSFELVVNGKTITTDPGSYTYTCSKIIRNSYRSSWAHTAPSIRKKGSDAYLDRHIFSSPEIKTAQCFRFNEHEFWGGFEKDGCFISRRFLFLDDRIEIIDEYALTNIYEPASKDIFKPADYLPFSRG